MSDRSPRLRDSIVVPPTFPAFLDYYLDAGVSNATAATFLVETLLRFAQRETTWQRFDRGARVVVTSTAGSPETGARAAFTAVTAAGLFTGTAHAAVHPSGWVRIDVVLEGALAFRAWADRVYEEIDLWPGGWHHRGEPPGAIGKRGTWISIRPGWPGFESGVGLDVDAE